MVRSTTKGNRRSCHHTSNIAYWMIRLMHDNPILPLVRYPYKLLTAAGLETGFKVLEVGCGPVAFASRVHDPNKGLAD